MRTIDPVIFTRDNYKPFFAFWKQFLQHGTDGFYFRQRMAYGEKNTGSSFSERTIGLDQQLTGKIVALVSGQDTGILVVLTAMCGIMLTKYTEQESCIIDTPLYQFPETGNRYTDSVPVIMKATPDASLRAYLTAVQTGFRDFYTYQNFPLSLLEYNTVGDKRLYHTNILLEYEGLHAAHPGSPDYDLRICIKRNKDTISIRVAYNNAVFDDHFGDSFCGHLLRLLGHLSDLSVPLEAISLEPAGEQLQLLHTFNSRQDALTGHTLVEMFEKAAAEYGTNTAISYNDQRITYELLNKRADALACYLEQQLGVQAGQIVAVMTKRSPELITAILGVLKTGAAYLPVDPEYPEERRSFILQDAGIQLLLTDADHMFSIKDYEGQLFALDLQLQDLPEQSFESKALPHQLAYVIYTSGSTGRPKGVMVAHESCTNMALYQMSLLGIGPADAVLQFASIAFDASVSEIFKTLFSGAALVLADQGLTADPRRLVDHMKAQHVTVVTLPPSYQGLLNFEELSFLRVILSAGEAANPEHASAFSRYGDYYNAYGPTECAVCVSMERFDPQGKENALSIGTPVANLEVLILTRSRKLAPLGFPGEICVSGIGLSRGYLNRPGLTAEKFIPHPFKAGERIYLTGDLGRWLPDGRLEFLGRKDKQVKVRGYRIELEEIERNILLHPDVTETAVVARGSANELIAYYTSGRELRASELRTFLATILPAYMLPAYLVRLASFVHSAAGKIDLRLLPELGSITLENDYVPPVNELQRKLAAVWEEALERRKIGIRDNFFSIGGDSIKAIRLAVAVNQALQCSLEVNDIFTYNTIEALADRLTDKHNGAPQEDRLQQARTEVAAFREQFLAKPALSAQLGQDWEDIYPMSDIQTGMVYHSLLGAKAGIYREQMFFQIEDNTFDTALFEKAVNLLIEKHPILRTGFILDEGMAAQIVYRYAYTSRNIFFIDLSGKSREEARETVEGLLQEDKYAGFVLGSPELWQMRVFCLPGREYGILFTCNHALVDGWSNASLMTELSNVYFTLKAGQEMHLRPLRASYKDYITEQLFINKSEILKAYWQQELEGYSKTPLPFNRSPKFSLLDSQVKNYTFYLPDDLCEAVVKLNGEGWISIKHIFLTAFTFLIKLTTNTDDLTIGLVTNGRPEIPDGDKIIGCFTNTVPFRMKWIKGSTGTDWLKSVDAHANQLKTFDKMSLIEIMKAIGETTRDSNPVFDIIFNFVDFTIYEKVHASTKVTETLISEQPRGNTNTWFDFTVCRSERGKNSYFVNLNYQSGLYTTGEIDRIVRYYNNILQALLREGNSALSAIKIIPREELQQIFSFTPRQAPCPHATIHGLFEQQVRKTPGNTALVFNNVTLSYHQLNCKANQLARALREDWNIGRDDMVGLALKRSDLALIGILAILKAGGAYMPVDPDQPAERIRQLMQDADLKGLLTESAYMFSFPDYTESSLFAMDIQLDELEELSAEDLPGTNEPDDLAYLMYTSGSTGRPKGVMVAHKSVIRLVADPNFVSLSAQERILPTGALSFDASTFELWGALLHGATLYLLPDEDLLSLSKLKAAISANQITTMWFTSSWLNQLVDSDITLFAPLRQVLAGGDKLSPAHIERLKNAYPQLVIINGYGPTENTTFSLCHQVQHCNDSSIPIGKPVNNSTAFLLDSDLQPVPLGVSGELYVGGDGLARGYWKQAALTAEKFIPHPYYRTPGERLYRTGDFGRWQEDGTMIFLGRKDHQVKIRGFRIELREVEDALLQHPDVLEVVVTAALFNDEGTDKRLAAYYTAKQALAPAAMQEFLQTRLPVYMIPAYLIALEAFPLNANGKIDMKQLPHPVATQEETGFAAPVHPLEKLMASVWESVTGKAQVGIKDNFFMIGGDSIKAIQVSARLQKEGYKVEVKDIFLYPTIGELAREIKELVVKADQSPVTGEVLLGPVQRQFFTDKRKNPRHFNQSVMLKSAGRYTLEAVVEVFSRIQDHHDMLRASFSFGENISQTVRPAGSPLSVEELDLRYAGSPLDELQYNYRRIQESIDLEQGSLMKVALFHLPDDDRLLIVIHHLVVDGVSWRILLEDMETLFRQYERKAALELPLKTDAFQRWTSALYEYANSRQLLQEAAYWQKIGGAPADRIPLRTVNTNMIRDAAVETVALDTQHTRLLLTKANETFNTEINDLLLSALIIALHDTFSIKDVLVAMEGHGREEALTGMDLGRTVGWFTSIYPVLLHTAGDDDLAGLIKHTKEQLRKIPSKGVGFGILQHLTAAAHKENWPLFSRPQISFNYLGQFDSDIQGTSFSFADDAEGHHVDPEEDRIYDLDITAIVLHGQLSINISFNKGHFGEGVMTSFSQCLLARLTAVISFCAARQEKELTPSDLTYNDLSMDMLDAINKMLD